MIPLDTEAMDAIDIVANQTHSLERLLIVLLKSSSLSPALDEFGASVFLGPPASELSRALSIGRDNQLDDVIQAARDRAASRQAGVAETRDLLVALAASGVLLRTVGFSSSVLEQLFAYSSTGRDAGSVIATESLISVAGARLSGIHAYLAVEGSQLIRVIPVGVSLHLDGGGFVEITAIELRAAGGLVLWRASNSQVLMGVPDLVVKDQNGTSYVATIAWLEGPDTARRGASAFTPAPTTGELVVTLVFRGGSLIAGPVSISIA